MVEALPHGVEREPTASDDFIPIGGLGKIKKSTPRLISEFLEPIIYDYTKKHLPFCEPCARIELQEKINVIAQDAISGRRDRKGNFFRDVFNDDEVKKSFGTMDKFMMRVDYKGPKPRTLEPERKKRRDRKTGNINEDEMLIPFTCKKRIHKINIMIPFDEWEKWKEEHFKQFEKKKS